MSQITISNLRIQKIIQLHQLAEETANKAVEHALALGELLREVKAELPHGSFGEWLQKNTAISVRTAQRYMRAVTQESLVKKQLPRKCDMLSHVPENIRRQINDQLDGIYKPQWKPEPGYWYCTVKNGSAFWVVPDIHSEQMFHISKLYENKFGDSLFDGTRWPEPFGAPEKFGKINITSTDGKERSIPDAY
jgi:hypothetical protein